MPLEDKAANRSLGLEADFVGAPKPAMGVPDEQFTELADRYSAKPAASRAPITDEQYSAMADKYAQRSAERRTTTGSAPEGGPERRTVDRRQKINEIKRLKGEIASDAVRQANPGGRDTLVRNVPKIEERIAGARQSLIEAAPGPSRVGLASKVGGKALGAAGMALNVGEHYRALKGVNTEENKDAAWTDKFGAYVEQITGFPAGTSGRTALPSEVREANTL